MHCSTSTNTRPGPTSRRGGNSLSTSPNQTNRSSIPGRDCCYQIPSCLSSRPKDPQPCSQQKATSKRLTLTTIESLKVNDSCHFASMMPNNDDGPMSWSMSPECRRKQFLDEMGRANAEDVLAKTGPGLAEISEIGVDEIHEMLSAEPTIKSGPVTAPIAKTVAAISPPPEERQIPATATTVEPTATSPLALPAPVPDDSASLDKAKASPPASVSPDTAQNALVASDATSKPQSSPGDNVGGDNGLGSSVPGSDETSSPNSAVSGGDATVSGASETNDSPTGAEAGTNDSGSADSQSDQTAEPTAETNKELLSETAEAPAPESEFPENPESSPEAEADAKAADIDDTALAVPPEDTGESSSQDSQPEAPGAANGESSEGVKPTDDGSSDLPSDTADTTAIDEGGKPESAEGGEAEQTENSGQSEAAEKPAEGSAEVEAENSNAATTTAENQVVPGTQQDVSGPTTAEGSSSVPPTTAEAQDANAPTTTEQNPADPCILAQNVVATATSDQSSADPCSLPVDSNAPITTEQNPADPCTAENVNGSSTTSESPNDANAPATTTQNPAGSCVPQTCEEAALLQEIQRLVNQNLLLETKLGVLGADGGSQSKSPCQSAAQKEMMAELLQLRREMEAQLEASEEAEALKLERQQLELLKMELDMLRAEQEGKAQELKHLNEIKAARECQFQKLQAKMTEKQNKLESEFEAVKDQLLQETQLTREAEEAVKAAKDKLDCQLAKDKCLLDQYARLMRQMETLMAQASPPGKTC